MCAVILVQLTSSQPTVNIAQQDNDFCASGQSDKILSALSRLETAVAQLKTGVAEIKNMSCTSASENKMGMPKSVMRKQTGKSGCVKPLRREVA